MTQWSNKHKFLFIEKKKKSTQSFPVSCFLTWVPGVLNYCALLFLFCFPVLRWALVFLQGWLLPISLHVWEMTRWGRPLSSKIRPRFVAVPPCHLAPPLVLPLPVKLPLFLSLHPLVCGVASSHLCLCSIPCIQIHLPQMHRHYRRCQSHCDEFHVHPVCLHRSHLNLGSVWVARFNDRFRTADKDFQWLSPVSLTRSCDQVKIFLDSSDEGY